MWRYYLIATLIVLAFGSIVFARRVASLSDLRVEGTPRPGQTPTLTRAAAPSTGGGERFTGQGSWAMSALPGCFDEQKSVVGRSAALAHEIPPARDRIAPGTRLRWGDCAIEVGRDDLRIARGADRLRVPPRARLFARDAQLVLVWESGDGRTEIRTYARPHGT